MSAISQILDQLESVLDSYRELRKLGVADSAFSKTLDRAYTTLADVEQSLADIEQGLRNIEMTERGLVVTKAVGAYNVRASRSRPRCRPKSL